MKGHALNKAEAKAYAEEKPQPATQCPSHTNQLDRRPSDYTGAFEFLIDAKYASYFAVYCAGGYQAREVPANDNKGEGRLRPDPVRLYPSGAATTDPAVARAAIDRVLDDAGGDLRYYSSADPDGFASAARSMPKEDGLAISTLLGRERASRSPDARPPRPQVARAAIELVLTEAGGHFNYFARVAEGAFFRATQDLAPAEQATVTWLRRRAAGAGAAVAQ